jgi:hypothetical protein
MKKWFLFLTLFLLFPFVIADDDPFSFVNNVSISDADKISLIKQVFAYQLPQMQSEFNANSTLPQPFKFLLNNEKINLNVGDDFSIGLMFIDGKINHLSTDSFNDPDFNVQVSDQFLLNLHQENVDFKQSLNNGDLIFSAEGFFNKLKLAPIKIFLKLI